MLEITNVSKIFPSSPGNFVLREINLNAGNSEIVCVTGPNGSGKTTLLKIICGLILPTSGKIAVDGMDIKYHGTKIRRLTGFCSNEERSFYGRLSIKENFEFAGGLYGLRGLELKKRIEKLSEMFGITEFLNTQFQKCSSGFKQRASLVRSALHNPHILLIDELNKSIDPEFAESIVSILKVFAEKEFKTVLFSAHDLSALEIYRVRTVKINNGLIQE